MPHVLSDKCKSMYYSYSSLQQWQKSNVKFMDNFSSTDIWQEFTSGISCYLVKKKMMRLLSQLVYSADFLWQKKMQTDYSAPKWVCPELAHSISECWCIAAFYKCHKNKWEKKKEREIRGTGRQEITRHLEHFKHYFLFPVWLTYN